MLSRILLSLFALLAVEVHAERLDSAVVREIYHADSLKAREKSRLRETIQGLDRTEEDYIEPNHFEFSVMFQVTRSFENFVLSSNEQSIELAPDGLTKIGPYFGWRWLFLGYTFDIKNLSFKGKGGLLKEIDACLYSSQIGVDVYYNSRSGDDYKIREVKLGYGIDGDLFDGIPFGGMKVGITGVSAYYIFNHEHFSYPAAFSQSTRQKISCGSWMAGAGYTHNTLDFDHKALQETLNSRMPEGQEVKLDSGMMFNSIKYNDFMLSGGYAYNWVFAKNWLFCASGQLAVAYKTTYGNTVDEKKGFDIGKVNPDMIGRFALVYNNDRWYAGASAILRTNNYHTSRFKANNNYGTLSAYVGYNFVLKKKYRKKK